MFNAQELKLLNWGLSAKTVTILVQEPEIVEDLAKIRKLPPLRADFNPKIFEIKFDDVTYIWCERDKPSYYHPCSEKFKPTFSEYRMDGETVLFHVDGEVVVERTANLNLDKILKSWRIK